MKGCDADQLSKLSTGFAPLNVKSQGSNICTWLFPNASLQRDIYFLSACSLSGSISIKLPTILEYSLTSSLFFIRLASTLEE